MNTYIITKESYKPLAAWHDHGEGDHIIARFHQPYFRRCRMVFGGTHVVAHVEHRHDGKIKINVTDDKVQVAKMLVDPESKDYDYGIHFDVTDKELVNSYTEDPAIKRQLDNVLTFVCQTYLIANAFMFFGNIAENKTVKAQGRNTNEGKVIVFRVSKSGALAAVPMGHHRSPEGVFPVRGHLRHYRDGKMVWIDEYFKGVENEK